MRKNNWYGARIRWMESNDDDDDNLVRERDARKHEETWSGNEKTKLCTALRATNR